MTQEMYTRIRDFKAIMKGINAISEIASIDLDEGAIHGLKPRIKEIRWLVGRAEVRMKEHEANYRNDID